MADGRLKGETALVTGAARRLGRAIALALADEGCNVVVHCRSSTADAGGVREEIERRGAKAWVLTADLSDQQQTDALVERAIDSAGSIDLLVNNASIFHRGGLDEMDLGDVLHHFQVNAWAPLSLSREFKRLSGRGKIVNIVDTRVDGYDLSHAAYILSKHALRLVTEMTALAYAPRITVNAVAPGLILPPPGKSDEWLDHAAGTVPLRRRGSERDVAEAVLYLLKSEFVTGEVIHVDGGRHLSEYRDGTAREGA